MLWVCGVERSGDKPRFAVPNQQMWVSPLFAAHADVELSGDKPRFADRESANVGVPFVHPLFSSTQVLVSTYLLKMPMRLRSHNQNAPTPFPAPKATTPTV